jgi:hypothetical protein
MENFKIEVDRRHRPGHLRRARPFDEHPDRFGHQGNRRLVERIKTDETIKGAVITSGKAGLLRRRRPRRMVPAA